MAEAGSAVEFYDKAMSPFCIPVKWPDNIKMYK